MGISQILNEVKNFVKNVPSTNAGQFLGRAVVVIKDNPIAIIATIVCVAAIGIGIKCYNSLNFLRRAPLENIVQDVKPIELKKITSNKINDELSDRFKKISNNNLNKIEEKFEQDFEIKNESPPSDLPPEAPSLVKILRDAQENFLGLRTEEDLEDDWSDIGNPPSDLPPEAPSLTKILRDARENFLGKIEEDDLEDDWNDIGNPPSDLPPEAPSLVKILRDARENFLGKIEEDDLEDDWNEVIVNLPKSD